MKIPTDAHERLMSAFQLLQSPSISISTFEQVRTLIKGIHPGVDEKLELCSKALSNIQKIQAGDIITLSAESLPQDSEEQKKRKKIILFFITNIKDLQSEIKRVDAEFSKGNTNQANVKQWGSILKYAKGPFGVVTMIAVIIVVAVGFLGRQTENVQIKTVPVPTVSRDKIQVITYNEKQIPLSQLYVGHGADCDSPHYHAINGSVKTVDGITMKDPEGCGFGKVKDVNVIEVVK